MDIHVFIGTHILCELYGINFQVLNNLSYLENVLITGVSLSNATLCDLVKKQFSPNGLSIIALLSESHASIHTYPENNSIFLDAFTCGSRCKPEKIIENFIQELKLDRTKIEIIKRGDHDFKK